MRNRFRVRFCVIPRSNMAISNQEPQLKEFLQHVDIRTMKKDLARLRELDALQERKKIGEIKTSANQPSKQDAPFPAPKPPAENGKPVATIMPSTAIAGKLPDGPTPPKENTQIPRPIVREKELPKKDLPSNGPSQEKELLGKEYRPMAWRQELASEEEKQQIFLYKSQRSDLAKQWENINKEEKPPLASEKNGLLNQKRGWQKKLDVLQKEGAAHQDSKPGNREDEEKRTWSYEQEIQQLDEKIKAIDQEYAAVLSRESIIQTEIKKIDEILERMYMGISAREASGQGLKIKLPSPPPAQKAPINFRRLPTPPTKITVQDNSEETGYLKDVSPTAREKLASLGQEEHKKRLKFMEEVEKWAAAEKK